MHSKVKQESSRDSEGKNQEYQSEEGSQKIHNSNTKHPKQATAVLKKWLVEHLQNPYLKPAEKA